MSSLRPLIVTGATGKQGGALIAALLAQPTPSFEIYAVTRNKASGSAQKLASKPNVHIVEGDFDSPSKIFDQVPKPWGLFLVTPVGKAEEQLGKAVVDAAFKAGVQHTLFTSVDRSTGQGPTPIPHFRTKHAIENHIVAKAARKDGVSWTFLRPVPFFDNITDNFPGKAFVSLWRLNGNDRRLQYICTADIGRVAADALLHYREDEYRNKAISLAGDDLSPNEAAAVFREVTRGQELPDTYSLVGRAVKLMISEMRIMFNWFRDVGYQNDIGALRERYPFLKDFRAFLKEESDWKVKQ